MATIVWPASLPQELRQTDFVERPPNLMVRTESDLGEAQLRRRGTAGPTRIEGSQLQTKAQVDTLVDFFRDTLAEGTKVFEWTHPRTGNTVDMRFRSRPEIDSPNGDNFPVKLDLEILP